MHGKTQTPKTAEGVLKKINERQEEEGLEPVNAFELCIGIAKRARQRTDALNERVAEEIGVLRMMKPDKEEFRKQKEAIMRDLTEDVHPVQEATDELYRGTVKIVKERNENV